MTEVQLQSLADVVKANKQVQTAGSSLRLNPCDIGQDGNPCKYRDNNTNGPCRILGAMKQAENGMVCLIQQAPITIVDLKASASKRS